MARPVSEQKSNISVKKWDVSVKKADVSVDVSGEKKCAGDSAGRWRTAVLAAVSVFVKFVESAVFLCCLDAEKYLKNLF